jgi:hypothetical protein
MAITQGQQGRLCFAFLFEEDEERRKKRGNAANTMRPSCIDFLQRTLFKNNLFGFFPRFCGVLVRSKSAGSCLFRVWGRGKQLLLFLQYMEDRNLARVPPPSEFSMSRSKNFELGFLNMSRRQNYCLRIKENY